MISFDRRRHARIPSIRLVDDAPFARLAAVVSQDGPAPEDGRQHGTRSDMAEAQMNRNKDGITTQLGAAERRGRLPK